jgi:hypothetical protein
MLSLAACCASVLQHVAYGVHYAWLDFEVCLSCTSSCRENRGYSSFEDFLGDLKQSKRKSIRQVHSWVLQHICSKPALLTACLLAMSDPRYCDVT